MLVYKFVAIGFVIMNLDYRGLNLVWPFFINIPYTQRGTNIIMGQVSTEMYADITIYTTVWYSKINK